MSMFSKFGWGIKFLVFPAILSLVVLAAIAGYSEYYEKRIAVFLNPSLERAVVKENDNTVIDIVSPPDTASVTTMISVDSYPPGSDYPLSEWQIVEEPGGTIEWITINDSINKMDEVLSIKAGDILELGGWAGQQRLGMRFSEVLISICGRVIAGGFVEGVRADIATSVHPNLMSSGWSIKLNGDDFPDCDKAVISGWGRSPVGNTVRPLEGAYAISLDKNSKTNPPIKHVLIQSDPQFKPSVPNDFNIAQQLDIEVPPEGARLYQCANIKCNKLADLSPGILKAVVIEELDGWYLLQTDKGSGWASSTTIVVLHSP